MISVLISTYNRAASLPRTLETFCAAQAPPGGWELILVDNRSSDGTRDVLRQFQHRLPLKPLYESTPGKAHALRTGLQHVEGDVVILSDDDILLDPRLLCEYRRVADAESECDVFGGPVLPEWPSPPPEWALFDRIILSSSFAVSFPELRTGPVGCEMLLGPNFALRTAVYRKFIDQIDLGIGPNGTNNFAMGSETVLLKTVGKAGHKAFFIEEAVVRHIIRPEQLEKDWVLSRAFRVGRGTYRVAVPWAPPVPMLFGVPRYALRQTAEQAARLLRATLTGESQQAFVERWKLNYLRGVLAEARSISQSPGKA